VQHFLPGDAYISVSDAAREYDIKDSTLYWRINHHHLEAVEVDGVKYVTRAATDEQPRPKTEYKPKRKYSKKSQVDHHAQASRDTESDSDFDLHIAYAYGHVSAWLEIKAHSMGIPAAVLAQRVGQLLQEPTGGKGLGFSH
jgi:transposase-like protein